MSIKVKGFPIHNDELCYDINIPFSNLTVKGQKRLFLLNKDIFLCDALASKHTTISELAHNNLASCSSKALNEAIIFLHKHRNVNLILEILNIEYFKLEKSVMLLLSNSDYWQLRLWVANDLNTPYELLLNMFYSALDELFFTHSLYLFDAIVNNTNFKKCKQLQDIIDYIYKENNKSPSFLNNTSEYKKIKAQVHKILDK